MNLPPIDLLLTKVDSKYALVVLTAKRARVIAEEPADEDDKSIKPVSRALYEIANDKITYERTRDGIK